MKSKSQSVTFRISAEDYIILCGLSEKLFGKVNVSKTIKFLLKPYINDVIWLNR